MRNILILFGLIFMFTSSLLAQQVYMENTQYLPQIAGGGYPSNDWETIIAIKNLTSDAGTVAVEFYGDNGSPLVFETSKGVADHLGVSLNGFASEEITLLRNTGKPTQVGWAKFRSALKFSVSGNFKSYSNDVLIGLGGVLSSPAQLGFSCDLDPNNGIAIVNPNNITATVVVKVFDTTGVELTANEIAFQLTPGQHVAEYFWQQPFNLNQKGMAVLLSNVPLSTVALRLDGIMFATIPIMPLPRRQDTKKIGITYLIPSDRVAQPDVAERMNEFFNVFQRFL